MIISNKTSTKPLRGQCVFNINVMVPNNTLLFKWCRTKFTKPIEKLRKGICMMCFNDKNIVNIKLILDWKLTRFDEYLVWRSEAHASIEAWQNNHTNQSISGLGLTSSLFNLWLIKKWYNLKYILSGAPRPQSLTYS